MPQPRVGGTINLAVNGEVYFAKGNFTYNLGKPKREGMAGSDRVHGYTEKPQVPFIEGEITFHDEMSLEDMVTAVDATVTIELANGKTIALRQAWYAADGTGNSEEGNVEFRFEGMSADEI